MLNLISDAPLIMGSPITEGERQKLNYRLNRYFDFFDLRWFALGAFLKEELVAMTAMIIHDRMPAWIGLDLFVKKSFPWGLQAMHFCNLEVLKVAKQYNLTTSFCTTSVEHLKQLRMLRVREKLPYWPWISFCDGYIPANTLPANPFLREMLGETTWKKDVLIWRTVDLESFQGPDRKKLEQCAKNLAELSFQSLGGLKDEHLWEFNPHIEDLKPKEVSQFSRSPKP